MNVIYNCSLDPYFNLALEEVLLTEKDDYFMLWRNSSSVIIGKNQNAYSEVNIAAAEKYGIKTVRRLTGGGAVFHDPGNVNFSFVTDAPREGEGLDFGKFLRPIISSLGKMGVSASADGRNDIVSGDCKISGNAQCVYNTPDGRRRLLHHGTLLFSADMSILSEVLRPDREKLEAKGVKSVRSRVKNICDIDGYTGEKSAEGFISALLSDFGMPRDLTELERSEAQRLANVKYSTWQWNFGSSPSYSDTRKKRFPYGSVEVSVTAKSGMIGKICITGDFFGERDISEICLRLTGKRILREELILLLSDISAYISGASPEDICSLII